MVAVWCTYDVFYLLYGLNNYLGSTWCLYYVKKLDIRNKFIDWYARGKCVWFWVWNVYDKIIARYHDMVLYARDIWVSIMMVWSRIWWYLILILVLNRYSCDLFVFSLILIIWAPELIFVINIHFIRHNPPEN